MPPQATTFAGLTPLDEPATSAPQGAARPKRAPSALSVPAAWVPRLHDPAGGVPPVPLAPLRMPVLFDLGPPL